MKRLLLFLLLSPLLLTSEEMIFSDDYFTYSSTLSQTQLEPVVVEILEINKTIDNLIRISHPKEKREITIFEDIELYHNYLTSIGIPTRDDFILLQYSNRSSKLVIYLDSELNRENLLYHMVIQYMDHYSSNTPIWFAKGLAYNLLDREPHRVVESLKEKDYKNIYSDTSRSSNPPFNSCWVIIHYLLNGSDNEKRLLWDTISKLRYDSEYTEEVMKQEFLKFNLDKSIEEYLNNHMGYNDYMTKGIELYMDEKFKEAQTLFKSAIELEPEKYSPVYYLGMTFNGLQDYSNAYNQFTLALDRGAPKDLLYYSIGLNFYQQKEFNQALNYLERIEDTIYKKMAEEVIHEISTW